MKHTLLNEELVIFVDGIINSTNAEDVSKNIEDIRLNNSHDTLKVDLGELTYLSSAGLRVFLSLKKVEPTLEIINVTSEVYEIFQMTGFTEIIPISKGLKEVSIEGKELIGEGFMGRVYRMDEDTIIKVNYRDNFLDDTKRERELAKKAFILGVPTAISFDVVKVKEGGFGSMFELLKSNSLQGLIIKNPDQLDKYIDIYNDLLVKINAAEDLSRTLPSKRQEALGWVADLRKETIFTKEVLDKMEKLINTIPDDANIIHGDYHIKNVMMQGDEALLIDMDTIGYGNIFFEFVAMFLTYIGYGSTDPDNMMAFLKISNETALKIFKTTVFRFLKLESEDQYQEVENKLACLGYMWLAQKTLHFEPENKIRLNHAVDVVNDLVNKLDTLKLWFLNL